MRHTNRLAIVVLAAACGSAHGAVNYWDFSVFSRSTIGSSGHGYGSQFGGASGAVGDAWFSSFGGRTNGAASPSLPLGFYGGGDLTLSGSIAGGVAVAGDVWMDNASIAGDVYAGGDLGGTGGSISGGASLGGAKVVGNQLTVAGSIASGQSITAPVDLSQASAYFSSFGGAVSSLAPTTTYTNAWGNLIINATGDLTVVELSQADFQSAWGVTVNGPGTVVVSVDGASLTFASKNWMYQGGASNASTLLTFADATSIQMSGGHDVNMLAPNAAVHYTAGTVTGNLIVGALTGSGSVAWGGGFQGGSAVVVPAPSGAAAIALGACGAMVIRRRRRFDR